MSEPSPDFTNGKPEPLPPGVIPYVDYHQGPRRLLTVELTSGNPGAISKHSPIVSIDGRVR